MQSNHRYVMVDPQPVFTFKGEEDYNAGEGKVWLCTACGKLSKDLMGDNPINRGWDESCSINAVLVYEHTN